MLDDALDDIENKLKDILIPSADDFKKKIKEVDGAAYEVVKTFGLSNKQVMAIKSSLTGAVSEVERLGGKLQDVVDIQTDIGKVTGRNAILLSDSFEGIYAAAEVSGQNAKDMSTSFKDTGFSLYDMSKQMEGVVNTARSIGVNVHKVSSAVVDNMGELNRFNFEGGVKGLSKMAANATNLRIDMKRTLDFADKVFDPEEAIEMAASMQRLGVNIGGLVDPMELMYNAMNDPGKLQTQIGELAKSFTKMNSEGNFEIMPGSKRRLREIAKATGYSVEELSKMGLAAREVEKKMSQIRMPSGLNLSEDQQKMIANMSEMKDGVATIKFTDEDGEAQEKKVFNLDKDDLKSITEQGKPKSIEEIQKGQLNLQERINASVTAIRNKITSGVAGSKTTDDTYKMGAKIETTLLDAMSDAMGKTKDISATIDNTTDVLIESMQGLVTGEKGIGDVFKKLGEAGAQLETQFSGNFKTALENATKSLNEFAKGDNKLVPLLEDAGETLMNVGNNSQQPPEVPVKANDFIKMPGMTIETLAEDTIFGGTGFESFIDGLKGMKTLPNNTNMGNNQFEEFLNKVKDVKSNNVNNENQTPIETKSTADINLNIKIDAPNQIDTNQIILALENQGVKQKLYQSMKEAMYNNGLSSPTSSKTKLMNPYLNR